MAEEWITTNEAAKIVGVTSHQIRHLLRKGIIKGKQFAHAWMAERQSVEEYAAKERKPGPKPKKGT